MNKSLIITLFVLAVCTSSALAAGQKKCRALVLEAGGDLGSFEAGAFQAFVDHLPAEEVQYDVFTGISIGSINSLGLSQFPKGQEKEQAAWLVNLWKGLHRKDVYKNYKGGIVQGLLYEKGIFDSTPALELMRRQITRAPQRKLNVGTCDLRTGELVRYHENLPLPSLIEAALASGSVPAFFPYSTFDNHIFVDGGTTGQLVDIQGAIDRCREVVDNDEDIIVDMIFVQFAKLDVWASDKKKKTIEVATRSNTIQNYVKAYREYLEAVDLYPNVNFRYVIRPSKALYSPKIPFLFDNKQMNTMIGQGYEDAKNQISANANGNGKEVYEESLALLNGELNGSANIEGSMITNRKEMHINKYNNLVNSL